VVNGGRIRKVTITEIEDGQDWSWPDPGNIEEDRSEDIDEVIIEKTTDEVFAALEDVVTDWKIKLEVVVGDGLKKIKKASREKKAMMKHLPGDDVQKGSGVLVKAKEEILNDWKKEVAKTVKDTHNKLNDLGTTKVKDVVIVSESILKKAGAKPEKKALAKNSKAVVKDAYLDLKKLMRELDTLYQNYNFSKMNFDKVPIYTAANKNNKEIARPMNKPFPWWKPMCTLADMADMPRKSAVEFLQKETAVAEILQDFIQDQAPYKSLLEEWFNSQNSQKRIVPKTSSKREVKTPRRGSNSIMRMKERKEQRQMKQYQLKEFENNGEKRYLVIKKKTKNTMDEVEDIFADWNKNFSIIKRPRSSKPRQRKLSHRQERKELLKSVEEEANPIGPLTYAEMLRRGLKKPSQQEMMEDIFQNWTNFLDELTEIRDPQRKNSKASVDELDFFKVWKHNLHVPAARMEDVDIIATTHPSLLPGLDCGQPTVKMAVKKEISPQQSAATKMPSVTSTKKKVKSPPGFSSKQNVKVLPGKQIIPKAEEKPRAIPIPPPPPPPPTPVKKPYEPVAPNKQLLPFVEKPLIAIPPPPPMPPKPASIPLHDPSKKSLEMKPETGFKPSAHSQRMLTPPKSIASVSASSRKVESKPQLTAEQIYECAKNSSNKSSWQSMLIPAKSTSPSGRGDSKRKLPSAPEEVFQSWRYIFTEENMKLRRTPFVVEEGYESIFKEWAELNLKEPEPRKRVGSNSTDDESPKASRKAMKKQIKCENIEDDMTEFKDNRRHDFAKNASIKDKKRTDAVRRSTGRKIK